MEKEENLLFDHLKVLSILKFPIVLDSLCQFSTSAFVSFISENIEIGFFAPTSCKVKFRIFEPIFDKIVEAFLVNSSLER